VYKAKVVIFYKALFFRKIKHIMNVMHPYQPDILPVLLCLKEAMINLGNDRNLSGLKLVAYLIQITNIRVTAFDLFP
jgi:hypothetical protein